MARKKSGRGSVSRAFSKMRKKKRNEDRERKQIENDNKKS